MRTSGESNNRRGEVKTVSIMQHSVYTADSKMENTPPEREEGTVDSGLNLLYLSARAQIHWLNDSG